MCTRQVLNHVLAMCMMVLRRRSMLLESKIIAAWPPLFLFVGLLVLNFGSFGKRCLSLLLYVPLLFVRNHGFRGVIKFHAASRCVALSFGFFAAVVPG
jgi:hypothetical protein